MPFAFLWCWIFFPKRLVLASHLGECPLVVWKYPSTLRLDGWYGQASDSRLKIGFVQAFEGIVLLVSRATAKTYGIILTPDSYSVSLSGLRIFSLVSIPLSGTESLGVTPVLFIAPGTQSVLSMRKHMFSYVFSEIFFLFLGEFNFSFQLSYWLLYFCYHICNF